MQSPELILVMAHGWGCTPAHLEPMARMLAADLTRRTVQTHILLWDQQYFAHQRPTEEPSTQGASSASDPFESSGVAIRLVDLDGLRATVQAKPDAQWIGIGHSLGFAKLWQLSIRWTCLVGLHGFIRFCPADGQDTGTSIRIIERMMKRLQSQPTQVLKDFYDRMNLSAESAPPPPIDCTALMVDLHWMTQLCEQQLPSHQHKCPLLWFESSQSDLIVPPDLSKTQFQNHGHMVHRKTDLPHAGPLTSPQSYTPDILAFLDPWS